MINAVPDVRVADADSALPLLEVRNLRQGVFRFIRGSDRTGYVSAMNDVSSHDQRWHELWASSGVRLRKVDLSHRLILGPGVRRFRRDQRSSSRPWTGAPAP